MDKNEFKTKYDEIKQLIKEGRTDEALDIVESTNWRKVHNVNALVKASEVCEEAGRLEEARELLYMARPLSDRQDDHLSSGDSVCEVGRSG